MDKKNDKSVKIKRLSIGIVLIIALTTFAIALYRRQTLSASFYNVDAQTAAEIGRQLSFGHMGRIVIKTLDGTKQIQNSVTKKYHLLFAWDGMYGLSLDNFNADKIPILTDNYEISFNRAIRQKTNFPIPATLSQMEKYLMIVKQEGDAPLFVAGADENDFCGFISAMTESMGGAESYEILKSEINKQTTFEDLLDMPLSEKDKAKDSLTLRTVLEKIKLWQKNGLLSSAWLEKTIVDKEDAVEKRKTAAIFMQLSFQRRFNDKLMQTYDVAKFTPDIPGEHALVAPQLCAIVFNKTAGEDKALARILSRSAQERLSKISKLAPVNADAQPYDTAADDVRFWAESCAAGAKPPVAITGNMAQKIRAYLE